MDYRYLQKYPFRKYLKETNKNLLCFRKNRKYELALASKYYSAELPPRKFAADLLKNVPKAEIIKYTKMRRHTRVRRLLGVLLIVFMLPLYSVVPKYVDSVLNISRWDNITMTSESFETLLGMDTVYEKLPYHAGVLYAKWDDSFF